MGVFCCYDEKNWFFHKLQAAKGITEPPQKRKSGTFPLWKNKEYGIIPCMMRHRQAVRQGTLTPHRRFDSCWRNQKPRHPEKADGAFCITFPQNAAERYKSSAAADLSGGLAAVPVVQKDPHKVDDDRNNTQCYYNFEVQTAQEIPGKRATVNSSGLRLTSCPAIRSTTPMVSPASFSSTVPTTSPCWTGAHT